MFKHEQDNELYEQDQLRITKINAERKARGEEVRAVKRRFVPSIATPVFNSKFVDYPWRDDKPQPQSRGGRRNRSRQGGARSRRRV
jgi:hypothetical protein